MGYGGAPDLSAYVLTSSLGALASDAELATALALKANSSALPVASDVSPYGCGVAAAGTDPKYARFDHVHAPFAFSDAYRDTGQTVNLQTIVLRSVPVPASGNYAFECVLIGSNSALTLSCEIEMICAFMRGTVLLRSAVPTLRILTTLAGVTADIAANGTNADIKVTGIATQTINWKCWTIVRRSA